MSIFVILFFGSDITILTASTSWVNGYIPLSSWAITGHDYTHPYSVAIAKCRQLNEDIATFHYNMYKNYVHT